MIELLNGGVSPLGVRSRSVFRRVQNDISRRLAGTNLGVFHQQGCKKLFDGGVFIRNLTDLFKKLEAGVIPAAEHDHSKTNDDKLISTTLPICESLPCLTP